ncbi:MAG: hypothetical protein HUU35_13135, partial [Armatimonadetes bacterium]|nr:hypothetical protein [Armatimonadota bacterium]
MRRRPWLALLVGLGLAMGRAWGEDLVGNGGFADGLASWTAYAAPESPPLQPQIDRGVFRGSDMAAAVLTTAPGLRGLLRQGGLPRDPAVGKVRLSVSLRCRNLHPDWIIRIGVEQYRGGNLVRTLGNRWVEHGLDLDWTTTRLEVTLPPEAEQLGVFVGLWFKDELKSAPPPSGGRLWIDDVQLEPVAAAPATTVAAPARGGISIEGLYPLGLRGIFAPGEPLRLLLVGRSAHPEPTAATLALATRDYWGKEGPTATAALTLPAGDFRLEVGLPAPPTVGFWNVDGRLARGDELLALLPTGLCVLPPSGPPDPYFVADVNGLEMDVVPAMQRAGVSGRKIGVTMGGVTPDNREKLDEYFAKLLNEGMLAAYWKSGLHLIGNLYLGFAVPTWLAPEVAARRARGLFPYPDEMFAVFGDFVEAFARAVKGRVRLWTLSEEIDGSIGLPELAGGSVSAELLRYVLLSRIAHERLKKVDPENVVIGLAVSGDHNRLPRFPLVRHLLPDLTRYTDVVGPDLYTDSWNWCLEPSPGPEASDMRAKILDTLNLGVGNPRRTAISERGYGLPYHLAPDHPLERRFAELTARSLILGKSVPEVLFYATHMVVSGSAWRARQTASTDAQPLLDMALWHARFGSDGKLQYRPRSAVAAYATVARQLGGAVGGSEILPRRGVYAYLFRRPSETVAALWTTDPEPVGMTLAMPAAGELVDLMGDSRSLGAGEAHLTLTGAPQFLRLAGPLEPLAAAVRGARFPDRPVVVAEGHLADLSTLAVELLNAGSAALPATVAVDHVEGAVVAETRGSITLPPDGRGQIRLPLTATDPTRLGRVNGSIEAAGQTVTWTGDLSATVVPAAPANARIDGDLAELSGPPTLVVDSLESLQP